MGRRRRCESIDTPAEGTTSLRDAAFAGLALRKADLAEFRDRYDLSYEPTGVAASGWHPIEVKLKRTSGTITARRGYFAQQEGLRVQPIRTG